jgi:hypothetical protein
VLERLSRRIEARAVAALVALVLSGLPRFAVAAGPGVRHVCRCAAHGANHRCACRVCAEQARRARRGAAEKLPPCHRHVALEQIAHEEEREHAAEGVPSLKPSCGVDEGAGAPPSTDSFLLPPRPMPAPAGRTDRIAPLVAGDRESPAVPELPPPICR